MSITLSVSSWFFDLPAEKRDFMQLERTQKIFLVFCILFALFCLSMTNEPFKDDQVDTAYLDQLDLSKTDRIMIVAHPDDESLWGGAHLAKHNYFVVCLTNGKTYKYRRYWEFKNAMKITDTPNIILNYPDFQNGRRIDWAPYEEDIEETIRTLLSYKDWKEIATHNPDGEYGHQHHIAASRIVTKVCKDRQELDKLSYFGIYQWDKKCLPKLKQVKREYLLTKKKMFRPYHRERNTIKKHQLMHPYEEWIKAKEWDTIKKEMQES